MKNLGLMNPLGLTVKLWNKMMAILKEDNFMRMEIEIKMEVLPETGCNCGVSQWEGHHPGLGKLYPSMDKYFQILLTGFVVPEC